MDKIKTDTRTDKINRLLEFLFKAKIGDFLKPTPTARNKMININPGLYRDLMDFGQTYKEIGIENVREENGKLIGSKIVKRDNDLKKEIRTMKKEILDMKNILDNINNTLRRIYKK